MKRVLSVMIAVLGTAALAQAQSLGDAAKKEKERRQASKAQAPSPQPSKDAPKVFTEDDLTTYEEKRAAEGGEKPAAGGDATPATAAPEKDEATEYRERKVSRRAGRGAPRDPDAEARARERRENEQQQAEQQRAAGEAAILRSEWRSARQSLEEARRRLAVLEEEAKTLPPGLSVGDVYSEREAKEHYNKQMKAREQNLEKARQSVKRAQEVVDDIERRAKSKLISLN
jgi:hypothetical protein